MNIKNFALLSIMAAFLAGAFISVLDPTQVNWNWFIPVLALGLAGLYIFRKAHHGEARASHRLSGDLQILESSLENILGNLETINADSFNLPVYEARFEIDRLLREDLNNFANARESMKHLFGLQHYADVMSAFAAGERYINRVWSASTDGYVDEVHSYLDRATRQFREASLLFAQLQQKYQAIV
jgi:energy-coupling factor transporter transmembrane protein EcfT